MAPKHGLSALQAEETLAKRVKNSSTPASRSATPAEMTARVPFTVQYPPAADTKRKLSKKEQELADNSEFQVSPFVAKGASKKGELDQYYTVTPNAEWEAMKKYNNFISESMRAARLCVQALMMDVQFRVKYTRTTTLYTCADKTPPRAVSSGTRTSGSPGFYKSEQLTHSMSTPW